MGRNKINTYFKHFVEITDDEGKPITATQKGKFQENNSAYDLSQKELKRVKSKVFHHCKQAASNQQNVKKLKNDKKIFRVSYTENDFPRHPIIRGCMGYTHT